MDALVRDARIAYDDEGSGPLRPPPRSHRQPRRRQRIGSVRSQPADSGRAAGSSLRRARPRPVRWGEGESEYAWPDLARDLLGLLDVLGVDDAVSGIGSSMGTATLLHAVTLAPDRFDRLVLTCPPTAWAARAAQAGVFRAGALFVERNGKERSYGAGGRSRGRRCSPRRPRGRSTSTRRCCRRSCAGPRRRICRPRGDRRHPTADAHPGLGRRPGTPRRDRGAAARPHSRLRVVRRANAPGATELGQADHQLPQLISSTVGSVDGTKTIFSGGLRPTGAASQTCSPASLWSSGVRRACVPGGRCASSPTS